jgi:hypothetical protein
MSVMLGRYKYAVEPSVHVPICLQIETTLANLKRYESPGNNRIPAGLVEDGGEISVTHRLILS